MRTVNTYIGSPIERVEDYRFLRGEGQYIDDLKRPGMWYAAFFRSPIGHGGRITRLDVSRGARHARCTRGDHRC